MGSIAYDFLTESFLFKENEIVNEFKSFTVDEIASELRRYREYTLRNLNSLRSEIVKTPVSLKVFTGTRPVSIELLHQGAFYINQFVIDDPLFRLTHEDNSMAQAFNQSLGFTKERTDKSDVAKAVRYLKTISPMVASDYVKLLPASKLFEPPSTLPIHMSTNYYADILPKELLDWFRSHATVRSMTKIDIGLRIEDTLYPCRQISISYPEEELSQFYALHQFEPVSFDEKTSSFEVRISLPKDPPETDYFNAWVFQSLNKSAKGFFDQVLAENAIASQHGASFLTRSLFVFDLLQKTMPTKESITTHTANVLLNLEVPFFDTVDTNTLMRIRQDDGEAFQAFRIELERQLRDLRTVQDEDTIRLKAQNVVHELSTVQIASINRHLRAIRKQYLADSGILLGGLVGAVQTGGWSLIATAIAAVKGYRDWAEYRSKVQQSPSFFLWKVLGKPKEWN